MSPKYFLLASCYPLFYLNNKFLRGIKTGYSDRLRVLLYHDIPLQNQERFAAQLRWLAQSWTFISPQHFAAMISGEESIKGANLLLSFDDGFSSNRRVAEEVLNPLGIQALFFVVSDFVDMVNEFDRRNFIATNIFPRLSPEAVSPQLRNMSWDDLSFLLETGHTIGAHTRTHARLSTLTHNSELESEIIESADVLQRRLGVDVDHFAYTFGNLASFSSSALNMARKRFKFVYSGLRGDNSHNVPDWALRRDSISPEWPLHLAGSFLEGGADFHYSRDIARLEAWGKTI